MVKNHRCEFMVSTLQLEKIRHQAHESGYVRIADYLRDLALNRTLFLEEITIETNRNVKRMLEILNDKRRR